MVCLTQFLIRLDRSVFDGINSLACRSDVLDWLARLGADDHVIPVALVLLVTLVLLIARNRSERQSAFCCVICAFLAAAASMAVLYLLNIHYFRPRPFSSRAINLLFYHNTDSAFPSNPATLAFALSFAVLFYRRKVGAVMLALSLYMGLCRIVVGVHYPLDIVGGLLLGLACALLANAAEGLYRPAGRWLTSALYRLLAAWKPPGTAGGEP
ncbi:MAG: phosphatase PAP2 family protein [Actinomycetia bacterium]|nr:phosphatase PAP2 family protein [Actinomycetota bacterium]MCG2795984.1 phosphatase PAP2 family protein [Actinomycetes bacterium]